MSLDLGLLVLRVVLGLLMAGHGAMKLFGWFGGPGFAGTSRWLEGIGFRPGRFWALLAGGGEFGGGLALALGFLMPLPAVAIMAAMFIAIVKVHGKNGLWITKSGYEYSLVLLVGAAVLGLVSPDRYTLDSLLGIALPVVPTFVVAVVLAAVVLGVGLAGSRTAAPAVADRAA